MKLLSRVKRIFTLKNANTQKYVTTQPRKASKKKCYFCGKTNQLANYTDGMQQMKVCTLCAEYAHRRAYRRI